MNVTLQSCGPVAKISSGRRIAAGCSARPGAGGIATRKDGHVTNDSEQAVTRELEEDHDLLTYNEAGARLAEEIQRLESEAARDAEQAGRVRDRATQLGSAAERNGQRAKDDTGARGFLEYRPRG